MLSKITHRCGTAFLKRRSKKQDGCGVIFYHMFLSTCFCYCCYSVSYAPSISIFATLNPVHLSIQMRARSHIMWRQSHTVASIWGGGVTVDTNIASLSGLACVHESLRCAFHTRGSHLKPNLIANGSGSGVNRAPRSTTAMWILTGPNLCGRISSPCLMRLRAPSAPSSYLSSSVSHVHRIRFASFSP